MYAKKRGRKCPECGLHTVQKYGQRRGVPWVRRQLDAATPVHESPLPQPTVIVADTTFWGRSYGVCVFRSPSLKRNLCWTEVEQETGAIYAQSLKGLLERGWTVPAAVINGRRGAARVFEARGIPVQFCQFHQVKTVTKYLTRTPKTEAGQELRRLACTPHKTNEQDFMSALTTFTYEDIDTLWCEIDGVKVSFLSRMALCIDKIQDVDGFRLAGARDLVVMKLIAVCGRDEYKDYYDLAQLASMTDTREWPTYWQKTYPNSDPIAWIVALSHTGNVQEVPLKGGTVRTKKEVENILFTAVKELSSFI